jgi:hypothetical protein
MMKRFKAWGERERRIMAAFFVGGMLAGGCSSDHVLGNVDNGASGQGGGTGGRGLGGQLAPPFDAGYPGDVNGLGARQSWTGYIENYQAARAPSDVINVSFASDPSGVVVGTMTFGTGAAPPPATDPNVGYPPGLPLPIAQPYIAVGFPYTMANGSLVGQRLRFQLRPAELWTGWCGLQVPTDDSGFCVPNWGYSTSADFKTCSMIDPVTNQSVAVDCAKTFLCMPPAWVCTCSSTTCYPNFMNGDLSVDVTFADPTASGSIADGISANIHLTKDP